MSKITAFEQAVNAAADLAADVKKKAIEVMHRLFQDSNASPEIDEASMPDMPYEKKPIDKKKLCVRCGAATVMEHTEKNQPTACLTCGTVQ